MFFHYSAKVKVLCKGFPRSKGSFFFVLFQERLGMYRLYEISSPTPLQQSNTLYIHVMDEFRQDLKRAQFCPPLVSGKGSGSSFQNIGLNQTCATSSMKVQTS